MALSSEAPVPNSPPDTSIFSSQAMRFASLFALCAAALAAVAAGEGLEKNPFTLPDGTIIDPHTQPEEARAARDDPGSIYTTLSHNGPMGGMGRNPMAGHLRA